MIKVGTLKHLQSQQCGRQIKISKFPHLSFEIPVKIHVRNEMKFRIFHRYLRAKLSPIFTSGKLKWMYSEMTKCVDTFLDYLNRNLSFGENIDMKEDCQGFTTEVIGMQFIRHFHLIYSINSERGVDQ